MYIHCNFSPLCRRPCDGKIIQIIWWHLPRPCVLHRTSPPLSPRKRQSVCELSSRGHHRQQSKVAKKKKKRKRCLLLVTPYEYDLELSSSDSIMLYVGCKWVKTNGQVCGRRTKLPVRLSFPSQYNLFSSPYPFALGTCRLRSGHCRSKLPPSLVLGAPCMRQSTEGGVEAVAQWCTPATWPGQLQATSFSRLDFCLAIPWVF